MSGVPRLLRWNLLILHPSSSCGWRLVVPAPPFGSSVPTAKGPDGYEPRSLSLTAAIFWTLGLTTFRTSPVDALLWIPTSHTDSNSLQCKRKPKSRAGAVRPEGCFCNWKANVYFCLLNVEAKGHQGLTCAWDETGWPIPESSHSLQTRWTGARGGTTSLASTVPQLPRTQFGYFIFSFLQSTGKRTRTQRLLEVSSTNSRLLEENL